MTTGPLSVIVLMQTCSTAFQMFLVFCRNVDLQLNGLISFICLCLSQGNRDEGYEVDEVLAEQDATALFEVWIVWSSLEMPAHRVRHTVTMEVDCVITHSWTSEKHFAIDLFMWQVVNLNLTLFSGTTAKFCFNLHSRESSGVLMMMCQIQFIFL